MKISRMAQNIAPSLSRRLFSMAKSYDDVIDLTLGDPDIVPELSIRQAACDAIMDGRTRYSENAGLPALRAAISETVSRELGITVDPESEIVVTVGGMEALFLSLACLIDPGDEVIVFGPYYVNYIQMIRMLGGVPVVVETKQEEGFHVPLEGLDDYVTERTVAIIVNTPNNPTGTVWDQSSLEEISRVALLNDLVVISDEVYRTLVYDGEHLSISTLPNMRERTVLIDSASKRSAMTGYRLGYAIAQRELAASMTKMQENVAACAPLPSQYAAIESFSDGVDLDSGRGEFMLRRNVFCDALGKIAGITFKRPDGAFYLFVNVKGTGLTGEEFAYGLLDSEQVAVVPGVCYGEAYHDFVRIAYTQEVHKLLEAADRIDRFVQSVRKNGVA